jgi:hypothetical protein
VKTHQSPDRGAPIGQLNRHSLTEWVVIGVVVGIVWFAATGAFGFWPQMIAVWPMLLFWFAAAIVLVRGAVHVVREFRRGWREGGGGVKEP